MAKNSPNTAWFLTSPEVATSNRRGDPLGLRNITEEVAELLAPGLTNRTRDARWLTLLCWSLVESDKAWRLNVGGELGTASQRQVRYEWLRPLELLWVRRAIDLAGPQFRAAQWPGHRSVNKWTGATPNFGMSPSQLKNHRQLGAYGAYRILFRTLPLTQGGDGWTPVGDALRLADLVDKALRKDGASPNWKQRTKAPPEKWWINTGWTHWTAGGTRSLLMSGTQAAILPAQERAVLRPLLFADGSIRHRTAVAIGQARRADNYVALCQHLAQTLGTSDNDSRLRLIGLLAQLNEAGLALMRAIASAAEDGEAPLSATAGDKQVIKCLRAFSMASAKWKKRPSSAGAFIYDAEANALADIGTGAGADDKTLLTNFSRYHMTKGRGVRWFVLSDDTILLHGAAAGLGAGNFGYRLHALGRLAVQCGVIPSLPPALLTAAPDDEEDAA